MYLAIVLYGLLSHNVNLEHKCLLIQRSSQSYLQIHSALLTMVSNVSLWAAIVWFYEHGLAAATIARVRVEINITLNVLVFQFGRMAGQCDTRGGGQVLCLVTRSSLLATTTCTCTCQALFVDNGYLHAITVMFESLIACLMMALPSIEHPGRSHLISRLSSPLWMSSCDRFSPVRLPRLCVSWWLADVRSSTRMTLSHPVTSSTDCGACLLERD